jgi:hypothetical protein
MRLPASLLLTGWSLLGCASAPLPASDDAMATYGRAGGLVWVRGPWDVIKPSTDMDDVVDQLCPAVSALPGAQDRDYGREYCGVVYTLGDGTYYASFPSPLGPTVLVEPAKRKQCHVPYSVKDERGQATIQADYHSHPWGPSPMSDRDRRASTQIYFVRIQFDSRCQVMKLIPHLHEDIPGELFVRQGKDWKLVGHILPEDKTTGTVTSVEE